VFIETGLRNFVVRFSEVEKFAVKVLAAITVTDFDEDMYAMF
jgi:hypothetical protein